MSAEDLERYEVEIELQLYQEYKDVLGMFQYAIETERRFYLANKFDLQVRNQDGDTFRHHPARRLGVGHVPAGPLRHQGPGGHLQGREHRGAHPQGRAVADEPA